MKRFTRLFFLAVLAAGLIAYFFFYRPIFGSNVNLSDGEAETAFYIPRGSTYEQIGKKLIDEKIIIEAKSFHRVAKMMNYPRHVNSGKYTIKNGMSNRDLVGLLRSGQQSPVSYTFIKFRTLKDLAAHASESLEMSEMQLMDALQNETLLKKIGNLKPQTVMGIFIPNTYEIYWDITPEDFVKRMYKEYRAFWNDDRNAKRERFKLDRLEVMTLASIVEEETNKNEEKSTVAGVYLNRIRKGWKLEADPTVKFALQDFEIKRLLYEHLEVDSPYNTYKYAGIPPGPICTPSIPSIDAVLNSDRHDYMYFCAKIDGSGLHHFSKSLTEHLNYARDYHQYLDKNNIK